MICSFLSDRTSSIFIGSEHTDFFPVNSGIPQGSILGPFLFNIYLCDFPLSDPLTYEPGSIHYADDTIILASDVRPVSALNKIKRRLPLVENYFKKWRLKINTRKCGLTCFRNASGKGHYLAVKDSKSLNLTLNNIAIPLRSETKYLGIHFQNRFLFNKHGRIVLKKAKMVTASLKFLLNSKLLLNKTKILMYKTLIRPILTYGFCTWFSISPTVAKEIEIFERQILRCCCGLFRKPDKKWFSNKIIYEANQITPIMKYQVELLLKKFDRMEYHSNPLVRSLVESNADGSVADKYYLSPFNLYNDMSSYVLMPDTNVNSGIQFYEKASPLNYRG